jgi:hypothetical protein
MFPVSARGSRAHFGGLADFILRALEINRV